MPDVELEPAPERRRGLRSRPARVALGAAGLAAVLGGGAYAVTDLTANRSSSDTTAATVTAAAATATATTAATTAAATATGDASSKPSSTPSSSPTPRPNLSLSKADAERIEAVRRYAASAGAKDFKPTMPRAVSDGLAPAKVVNTGSLKEDGGTMRIVTAKGDLSGERELKWVAGGITKVGRAECSQTIQLANQVKPKKEPTLLLCWPMMGRYGYRLRERGARIGWLVLRS